MVSPVSKRIVSPSKQLSSSPRGNTYGRSSSGADILSTVFRRSFKWIMTGLIGIIFVRIITMHPLTMDLVARPGNYSFYDPSNAPDPNSPMSGRIRSSPNTDSSKEGADNNSDENKTRNGSKTSKTSNFNTKAKRKKPKHQNQDDSLNGSSKDATYHHQLPKDDQSTMTKNTNRGETTTNELSLSEKSDDLLSTYKASNAPVILDGWNRTVQVHLIVDITGSADFNPASKLLLAAVKRSNYTQTTAVTFVRPATKTFGMFPRKPELPLLFLIDWGSMNRDCHRLQLVLEDLNTSQPLTEKEEPYFLLVDSSGSTRQTGCNYLFEGITGDGSSDKGKTLKYARTNDMKRIRLAKRSIVQNRYYDLATKELHMGELSLNQWDDTPLNYDMPVLHSPFSLRESFVTTIQTVIDGKQAVANKDSKRDVDVGYFWKSGDYSHYGFYRRDIAKVVKTLHHSTLDKKTGKLMENAVGIVYSEEKGMEAGDVQLKYIEQMLACKIIVITQRDEWEDHYRLMESLASGALVMTDSMVSLPEGVVDKINIVVYDSPKMLKDLIKYYLKPGNKNKRKRIAKNGYKLVMGRHRCWHWLEKLLFGRPLTYVDRPDLRAPPKEVPPGLSYGQLP